MKTKIKQPLITCFALGLLLIFFTSAISKPISNTEEGDDQTIIETIEVQNTEVPVRVFKGKDSVKGLTKNDFQLFINGKQRTINGFYAVCNKLGKNASKPADSPIAPAPLAEKDKRLFVLIFNLSDAHQDMQKAMDIFFDSVVQPKDRIIVITNHYFAAEWEVTDSAKAKERVNGILSRQFAKLRAEIAWFENELKSMASTLKSRLEDETEKADSSYPAHIFEDFFVNYRFVLEDIKSQYLSLPVSHYIRIANYLRGQRMKKWIFNFYQVGRLPLLNKMGRVNSIFEYYAGQTLKSTKKKGSGGPNDGFHTRPKYAAGKIRDLYYQFTVSLEAYDEMMNKDIGKAFINTGATFHTMLMKPVRLGFSEDYQYQAVSSDTEIMLKRLSSITGGSIVGTNDMNKFIDDFSQKEDILYMLTYVPEKEDLKKRAETLPFIKVSLSNKNKNYRVVFDDQHRQYAFRSVERQLNRQEPDIEIEKVVYKDDRLTVKLKNIKMVEYDSEIYGAVRARIKILNSEAKVLNDFSKSFKSIDEKGVFQAQLPSLGRGRYNIVLEVKDLFSLKNTIVGEAISIVKY